LACAPVAKALADVAAAAASALRRSNATTAVNATATVRCGLAAWAAARVRAFRQPRRQVFRTDAGNAAQVLDAATRALDVVSDEAAAVAQRVRVSPSATLPAGAPLRVAPFFVAPNR
jgi:hypothetical protein